MTTAHRAPEQQDQHTRPTAPDRPTAPAPAAAAARTPDGGPRPTAAGAAGLTAATTRVLGTAADLAAIGEQQYGLAAEAALATTRAGFARHFVPARFGGAEGTFGDLVAASARLAEGCTSAAWWAGLQAAHGRLAAFLPERGQEEIWRDCPDVPIAAALVPPAGSLTRTSDGVAVQGRWRSVSGVANADWVLLAVPHPDALPGDFTVVAVERRALTVHETWRSNGLRGTGSHDVALPVPVAVPAHRCVRFMDIVRQSAEPGRARCHRVPPRLVAGLAFAAPAVGAARSALRAWVGPPAGGQPGGRARPLSPARGEVLARASAEIDIAGTLLEQAAARADEGPVDEQVVARNLRDVALAVESAVAAVERLFRTAGVAAQQEDSVLQRAWRDVHTLGAHGALDWEAAAAEYARTHPTAPAC
ncbi:oxidoreductase [Kitasatospora paranensis]|uniref:oxidoreductase n=1 Tax=Kitasatospora paranensis TaxID=258053 RepID=UPI0036082B3E